MTRILRQVPAIPTKVFRYSRRILMTVVASGVCAAALGATDPETVAQEKARKRFEAMKYYQFCGAIGRVARTKKRGPEERAAIDVGQREYGITSKALVAMEDRDIYVGMPLCGVVGSLGTPSEVREISGRLGTSWSVWYRDKRIMINLNADQDVTSYSR